MVQLPQARPMGCVAGVGCELPARVEAGRVAMGLRAGTRVQGGVTVLSAPGGAGHGEVQLSPSMLQSPLPVHHVWA